MNNGIFLNDTIKDWIFQFIYLKKGEILFFWTQIIFMVDFLSGWLTGKSYNFNHTGSGRSHTTSLSVKIAQTQD